MNNRVPKPDVNAAWQVPEPMPADYSDEISEAQMEAVRSVWTQDEAAMGPVVHEFKWY